MNTAAPPFDNPQIRQAMALALDRKAFIDILDGGKAQMGGAMLPGPEGQWALPPEELAKLPGYGADVEKNQAEARKIMAGLGYGPGKPLKVKVSVRNIAIYRDPAVILIDQLKKIHIDGELEPIDTTVWYAKVQRRDYSVEPQPDGRCRRRPRRQSDRELHLQVGTQLHAVLQSGGRQAHLPAVEGGRSGRSAGSSCGRWSASSRWTWRRPIIFHNVRATCWHPHVKGVVLHHNSIYNNWRLEDVWLDK